MESADWMARLAALVEVRREEPLSRHCTWRVGGPAEAFVVARSADELRDVLREAAASGVPAFVLGAGSNVLVGDRGLRGLVVKNEARRLELRVVDRGDEGGLVCAESGVLLGQLSRFAAEERLTGLEWAAGIPGTVGGAVVGNAGAHGHCLAETLRAVTLLREGEVVTVDPAELELGYRTSRLKGSGDRPSAVVLAAEFALRRGDGEAIRRRMAEYGDERSAVQPKGASAGSVFKNPPGGFAGQLIERAGLKGRQLGGAAISGRHANFIVNRGEASAGEIRQLIDLARRTVAAKCGVELELEVQVVGDWN